MISVESLATISPERRQQILQRGQGQLERLVPVVDSIIARVRSEGDAALLDYSRQFDHANVTNILVPQSEIDAALASIEPTLLQSLRQATAAIATFHRAQLPTRSQPVVETMPGVQVWRVWRAIERIGIYAPGGNARYPSSILMAAIPAHIAGCSEIVVCTPPGPDGHVPAVLLAAAAVAGVTHVYAVGGAQAIAAMAYGTETVHRVDKIVGPGSSYVAAAKLRVANEVAIDMPAGPSEVLIVADDSVDPSWIAADLIAQAEHGPESACVLVTPSSRLIAAVTAVLEDQVQSLSTSITIRQSLGNNSAILLADSLDDAIDFANDYATEHLELAVQDAISLLPRIQHAGSVFLGGWSPVAAGDYATGGNHTLPTARFARSFGPLAIESFGRWMQAQSVQPAGLSAIRSTIETLATSEQLPAHAASIAIRFKEGQQSSSTATQSTSTISVSDSILMNANENPYGPSPRAQAALAQMATATNRYPDKDQPSLRAALADYVGMPGDQIIIGNGSDEVIHLLSLALLKPGDEVIVCDPTFAVYAIEARRCGGTVISVPLDDNFAVDLPAVLQAITPRTRIIWLCTPNNPTGNLIDPAIIPALLAAGPVIILDEAYYPFGNQTAMPLLQSGATDRLVIMRTLSKWAALAGLRVGFAVCPPKIVAAAEAFRQPYNVNRLAEAAVIATLDDSEWLTQVQQTLENERERIAAVLQQYPDIHIWPSVTNFLLFDIGQFAAPVATTLAEKGVAVRFLPLPRLSQCLRVSVGRPAENDRFLAAFAEVYAQRESQPQTLAQPQMQEQEVWQ